MEIPIPCLSLSDYLNGNSRDKSRFITSLGQGLEKLGFVSLIDHQVEERVIHRAYQEAQSFFSLPSEIKHRYEKPELFGQRGYTGFQKEKAKDAKVGDLKEFWHVGLPEGSQDGLSNLSPKEVPLLNIAFETLYKSLYSCSKILLEACALYLGESKDFFSNMIQGGNTILRVIHYPPIPDQTRGAVRAAAHEDINFITLLCGATQPGLELLTHSGEWQAVPSHPGQIIVDTGDMLQNLSNGIFKSTTHRVVNPTEENVSRFSMPFFVHPRSDVSLAPLPGCIERLGQRGPFRDFSAGEYLAERLEEIGLRKKVSDVQSREPSL